MDITIADCAADDSCGGGLWADRANVPLRGGSRIERCTTGGDGGGILAYDNSKVALLEGSVLSSCHAGPAAFGGGLHLRHGFTSAYSAPDTPPHARPPSCGPMPACLPSACLLTVPHPCNRQASGRFAGLDNSVIDRQLQWWLLRWRLWSVRRNLGGPDGQLFPAGYEQRAYAAAQTVARSLNAHSAAQYPTHPHTKGLRHIVAEFRRLRGEDQWRWWGGCIRTAWHRFRD